MSATANDVEAFTHGIQQLHLLCTRLTEAHRSILDILIAHPDLHPELNTVSESVVEAAAATLRAAKFLKARLDAKEASC